MVSGPLDLLSCRCCGELIETPTKDMDSVVGYRCDFCGGLYENKSSALRCDHFIAIWRGGSESLVQTVDVGDYL